MHTPAHRHVQTCTQKSNTQPTYTYPEAFNSRLRGFAAPCMQPHYIYIYIYIYIHTYYTRIHTKTQKYTHMHIHKHIHIHMHTCVATGKSFVLEFQDDSRSADSRSAVTFRNPVGIVPKDGALSVLSMRYALICICMGCVNIYE